MTTNNTPISTYPVNNTPNGCELFLEHGDSFHRFSEAVCEIVDDAISDFRAHPDSDMIDRTVCVTLEPDGDEVEVSVLDGGSGIADLDNALTLAGKKGAETTLNEHGLGLKHALATACASRCGKAQEWSIQTRTEDDACLDCYREVCAPYNTVGMRVNCYRGSGDIFNRTGTCVSFRCSRTLFATVCPENSRAPATFRELVALFCENLSYTYSDIIRDEGITILVIVRENETDTCYEIAPLQPEWKEVTRLHAVPTDLGGGVVTLNVEYGTINASEGNALYYKHDMDSSGVELRLNGRAIEHGLIKRIWGEKTHNRRNGFLVRIDIRGTDRAALPATKSAKNGFREYDARLEQLFTWIRTNIPLPEGNTVSRERQLVHALAEKMEKRDGVLRVCEEEPTYRSIGLRERMDLYVSYGDKSVLYEAKVYRTRALDLYQLRMYWDGCALDGKPLTEAYLIARAHTKEVVALLKQLNRLCDPMGRRYNFKLTTWAEEGIAFPSAA